MTRVLAAALVLSTAVGGCDGSKCPEDKQIDAWADGDGDGWGGEKAAVCKIADGVVERGGDCDDTNDQVHPDATEACNGLDDDCDEVRDQGLENELFFEDLDRDGYGNTDVPLVLCAAPDDTWARFDNDCDDTDPDRHPGASEVCNEGKDDDCDGLVDDEDDTVDPESFIAYYPDADTDGYGRDGASIAQCAAPVGAAPNNLDCDDTDNTIHPDGLEICNREDDDCDDLRDDDDPSLDTALQTELFADTDGDGAGDPNVVVMACGPRPGVAAANDLDCDDTNPDVNPGENESLCDSIDNDCDVATTDDADRDEDGFFTCVDDCNDLNENISPAADETPGNGIDQDCDGLEDCYQDVDGDGSRTDVAIAVADPGCTMGDNVPANRPIDCDDTDPEQTISGRWVTDADLDGFGDGVVALTQCEDPGIGYLLEGDAVDCDDSDPTIHPDADEPCNDGIDANCDTFDTCRSCQEWLDSDPTSETGVYIVRPGETDQSVYCDMDTDGGGWTLVASTTNAPLNDARSAYHEELATVSPQASHPGVWDGLSAVASPNADLRFACKELATDEIMTVDLSFYDVAWYGEIVAGSDTASCFNEAGNPDPTPGRRNNLTDQLLLPANAYNSGGLVGEDTCGDPDDFTVDFDDAGMDFDEADGTDWGEDDGKEKCGRSGVGESWFLFVREL